MKLKEDATKTVMTLARISQTYLWCQEFLENILQELEALVLDDRTCPLLDDVIKDDSKRELWKSCHSEHIFEQQTAVRLLLLVCEYQFLKKKKTPQRTRLLLTGFLRRHSNTVRLL